MARNPEEAQSTDGATDVHGRVEAAKKTFGAIGSGKNIVLCSDGTGNRGGAGRGTNVWATFNAVWRQPDAEGKSPAKTQIAFYDDGVGTQKFIAFKLLGGAFGWGYSRNIRQLYKFLVLNYEPGDSIYLFGFSRGAYTVRGLAGLVLKSGILNRHEFTTSTELEKAVWAVFRDYRDGYKSIFGTLRRWLRPGYKEAYNGFKAKRLIHDLDDNGGIKTPIRFIGVWDTVDAVGLPIDWMADILDFFVRVRFRDRELHENVEKACHAVSIDDERRTFWPVLWTEPTDKAEKPAADNRIEQVWFPGVHSNVGGGYAKDQVAQVALEWMMERAEGEGLQFYKSDLDRVREAANPHGKVYDSRSGLAAYYRYHPRDIGVICDDEKQGVKIEKPKIHVSALRRAARATGDYAPAQVNRGMEVVGTRAEDQQWVVSMKQAFDETSDRGAGLHKVEPYVKLRRILYYAFLVYTLGIVGLALGLAAWIRWWSGETPSVDSVTTPWIVAKFFDMVDFMLPDFLFGVFNPLLQYAKVYWMQALIAVAVLVVFGLLKLWFETASRHLALDAWRSFRKKINPPKAAAKVG